MRPQDQSGSARTGPDRTGQTIIPVYTIHDGAKRVIKGIAEIYHSISEQSQASQLLVTSIEGIANAVSQFRI